MLHKVPKKHWFELPKPMSYQRLSLIVAALFALMLLLIQKVPTLEPSPVKPQKVNLVRIVKDPSKKPKQIVEAELPETLAPKNPDFLGKKDHQTARETRVKNPRQNDKEASAPQLEKALSDLSKASPSLPKLLPKGDRGVRAIPEGAISQFLPKLRELSGSMSKSHQDHITKDVEFSDVLDVNTTEYKWIGYFTNVRKMVAQTFYSPYEKVGRTRAIQEKLQQYGRAKMKGRAVVLMTIAKSGLLIKSELVSSSGDKEIDDFWERVLNLAAPFPPLPKHYEKDELKFTYALDYNFEWRREMSRNPARTRPPNPF